MTDCRSHAHRTLRTRCIFRMLHARCSGISHPCYSPPSIPGIVLRHTGATQTASNSRHAHTRTRSLRPLLLPLHAYWTLARNGLCFPLSSPLTYRPLIHPPPPTHASSRLPSLPLFARLPHAFVGICVYLLLIFVRCDCTAFAIACMMLAVCIGIVFTVEHRRACWLLDANFYDMSLFYPR
ncbi:hypothetical protein V8D89_005392 [Ganoderma adspersum]